MGFLHTQLLPPAKASCFPAARSRRALWDDPTASVPVDTPVNLGPGWPWSEAALAKEPVCFPVWDFSQLLFFSKPAFLGIGRGKKKLGGVGGGEGSSLASGCWEFFVGWEMIEMHS